jgi:hypothetical protein
VKAYPAASHGREGVKVRATIVLRDENGTEYTGTVELTAVPSGPKARKAEPKGTVRAQQRGKIDFRVSCRAFVKEHVSRESSGPQKFVIVAAWIAKGDTSVEIASSQIAKEWKRASGLLGGSIARVYGTRAKDNGWIDSLKKGAFVLQATWPKAFGQ